jgi:hypothetical protein
MLYQDLPKVGEESQSEDLQVTGSHGRPAWHSGWMQSSLLQQQKKKCIWLGRLLACVFHVQPMSLQIYETLLGSLLPTSTFFPYFPIEKSSTNQSPSDVDHCFNL